MNPLRTVGGRLALALLVVVAGALAIVYLIVVPSYQRSLIGARVSDLERTLKSIAKERPSGSYLTQGWVDEDAAPVAKDLNARVVVFRYPPLRDIADSSDKSTREVESVENDTIARRAMTEHLPQHGTVRRGGEEFAEAAYPIPRRGTVVLLSSSLHNDLESVAVVRSRVIVAGSLATVFAILLGYVLATLFARRIRRLERAAERIADGWFDEPVIDPAPDELGELARAFERMRLQLRSLDRARSEFIANASHELRTPLFSLAGFLELLTSEEIDSDTRTEFLNVMQDQVERLTKLATDLLDLSRMDAGRLSVSSESVDLALVGELLATEFGPRAAAAGHALELSFGSSATAWGDEARVLQIGRILIENAVLHTPPGTTIEVAGATAGGKATLAVTDNGPGIPEGAQTQVFERFYRLDGTLASGSGLGLAIARELAELMGGRIDLEADPGRTRFALVLAADPIESPTAAGAAV